MQRVGVDTQLAAILPRVIWSGELAPIARQLRTVYDMGVRQVLAGNLGQLHIARAAGSPSGAISASISSIPAPCATCASRGSIRSFLSFELTLPQIRDISAPSRPRCWIYGRLPLMLMENCVIKTAPAPVPVRPAIVRLVDRVERISIVKDPGTCRNVLAERQKAVSAR